MTSRARDSRPRLTPAVIRPPRDHGAAGPLLAVAALSCLTLLPLAMAWAHLAAERPVDPAPAVVVTIAPPPPPLAMSAAVEAPAPARSAAEVAFLERRGGTSFAVLAELPATVERGAARLLGTPEMIEGATADLVGPLPDDADGWNGQLIADNGCTAGVTRFVALAPATGSRDYLAVDSDATADAIAAELLRTGPVYLAAVLDGCDGRFVRRAGSPVPIAATEIDDRAVADAARARLLSSELAAEADAAWREAGHDGDWRADRWTELSVRIVRHPRTGERWVSVLAHSDVGCGGADIRIWAVYRVTAGDQLRERWTVRPDQLLAIDAAVDRDDDGELEWLGRDQLGDRLWVGSRGDRPVAGDRLAIPFYGCPC
jgi:hypothetical protein